MDILVTGARNGLGRYLCEHFDAHPFTRANASEILETDKRFDVVVHCAHSRAKDVSDKDLSRYLADTVFLTSKVAALCKSHLVLASSISVYPSDSEIHSEQEAIAADTAAGLYAMTKLASEAIGFDRDGPTSVLRLSSLLGPYSPPNVTSRVINRVADAVPLTPDSTFNYVHYGEVAALINLMIKNQIAGVFNVAGPDSIALSDVVALAKADVKYGSIDYQAQRVSVAKAAKLVPSLNRSSRERVEQVIREARTSS